MRETGGGDGDCKVVEHCGRVGFRGISGVVNNTSSPRDAYMLLVLKYCELPRASITA